MASDMVLSRCSIAATRLVGERGSAAEQFALRNSAALVAASFSASSAFRWGSVGLTARAIRSVGTLVFFIISSPHWCERSARRLALREFVDAWASVLTVLKRAFCSALKES